MVRVGLLFSNFMADLKVDESSMTGESNPVKKDSVMDPWLLCGCQIVEGRGKMLVLAVGELSQWGKIKSLVLKESEATPLQQNLEDLAESIGKMGLVAAGFTFVRVLLCKGYLHVIDHSCCSMGYEETT